MVEPVGETKGPLTGIVELYRDPDGGELVKRKGWVGDWPPPSEFAVVKGRTSGAELFIELNLVQAVLHENPSYGDVINIVKCRQISTSKTMENPLNKEVTLPVAVYVPEE